MFQFTPLAALYLCIQYRLTGHACGVSPFGYLRVKAC